LITGDIEARAERALAAEVPGLRADVVVVPHHGSATSSTAALTATVRPSLALVSAAYGNRWGFPKPAVRAAWEDAGARVLVTSTSGAITVELEPSGSITLETLRSRRYWRAAAL
jgi:competence protein ComEC